MISLDRCSGAAAAHAPLFVIRNSSARFAANAFARAGQLARAAEAANRGAEAPPATLEGAGLPAPRDNRRGANEVGAAVRRRAEAAATSPAEQHAAFDRKEKLRGRRSPACDSALAEVVRLLLARPEVDVNARDEEGRTPLYAAAFSGGAATVQALLAAPGVDVNAGRRGATPLYGACMLHNVDAVRGQAAAGRRFQISTLRAS
eukprot:tig00020911_g15706.t1